MMDHEKVNILLVDDQPAKLLAYEVILKELGENLVVASSGREALEYLLKNEVAVILVAVCMPSLRIAFEPAPRSWSNPTRGFWKARNGAAWRSPRVEWAPGTGTGSTATGCGTRASTASSASIQKPSWRHRQAFRRCSILTMSTNCERPSPSSPRA